VRSGSPYSENGEFLVSIIEGVAGNDRSIFTVMPETKEYTARYTVNETGFAVLEATREYVTYSHFSTKQGFMDEVKIIRSNKVLSGPNLRLDVDWFYCVYFYYVDFISGLLKYILIFYLIN